MYVTHNRDPFAAPPGLIVIEIDILQRLVGL